MVLETPMGAITIELYWNHAPKTCRVRMSAYIASNEADVCPRRTYGN